MDRGGNPYFSDYLGKDERFLANSKDHVLCSGGTNYKKTGRRGETGYSTEHRGTERIEARI